MGLTDKLGFSLHPFQRITWVSEALKAEWEPRLTKLTEAIRDVFTSPAVMELLPVHVTYVRASNLYEYKKKTYSKGLFAEHVYSMPLAVQYTFGRQHIDDSFPMIIGHRRDVVDFIAYLNDPIKLEAIARLPIGTIQFWERFIQHDLADSQWAYLLSTEGNFMQSNIYENSVLNTCWTQLDIAAIPYNASTLHCQESIAMTATIRKIAQEVLSADLYQSWYEVLSWPTQWTALHGIGEIKTPLFKMIYNTDASGTKYTLQFKSDTYPDQGLNGLLFPYRKPKKLLFSSSDKFKFGAIHLKNSLNL